MNRTMYVWFLILMALGMAEETVSADTKLPKFVSENETKLEQVVTIEFKLNNSVLGSEEYGRLHRAILEALNKQRLLTRDKTITTSKATTIAPTTMESTTTEQTTLEDMETTMIKTTTTTTVGPHINRRKRNSNAASSSSSSCDKTEFTGDQVIFVKTTKSTEDGILQLTVFLDKDGCNSTFLCEILKSMNESGQLKEAVGGKASVLAIYLGFPGPTTEAMGESDQSVVQQHVWLPIVIASSFFILLLVLGTLAYMYVARRKKHAYGVQESVIQITKEESPCTGEQTPLEDFGMTEDKGPKVDQPSNGCLLDPTLNNGETSLTASDDNRGDIIPFDDRDNV